MWNQEVLKDSIIIKSIGHLKILFHKLFNIDFKTEMENSRGNTYSQQVLFEEAFENIFNKQEPTKRNIIT